jgi:ubiquinone/menaquinone biosynthesis C-methylase UbiE
MKETKDLFSTQAETYANYRPTYPQALYDFLYSLSSTHEKAWDCATGNGQVASVLADEFQEVHATDISEGQLKNARRKDNVIYSLSRAENTNFSSHVFDLITVGTALHWFDLAHFYDEVRRVGKPGAYLAAWAYLLCHCDPVIDELTRHLYGDILKDYWDPERRLVEEEYRTIPFPFQEIAPPALNITAHWTRQQYVGYLNSWSSTQHYLEKNGNNPVLLISDELKRHWKDDEMKTFTFPLLMRVGRI